MQTTTLESMPSVANTESAQLNLGIDIVVSPACRIIKVEMGNKGDLIGRLRSGKIVILQGGYEDWVQGYALAEIYEEREKLSAKYMKALREDK